MPLSTSSARRRRVFRRRLSRQRHGCRCPETLERRTMLTGNDPVSGEQDAAGLPEPPAAVAEVGAGLGTFESADAYADWLVGQAVTRWRHLFGKPASPWWHGEIDLQFGGDPVLRDDRPSIVPGADGPDVAITNVSDGAGESLGSSTTNTQIVGVDEADLVEVSGDTLYALTAGRLSVVRGFAAAAPELVSQISLEGQGRVTGMYLSDNRLTIVSRAHAFTIAENPPLTLPGIHPPAVHRAQTTVTVLDVTDPSSVSVVTRTTLDGELVSSRMVDGELRLVLNHRLSFPLPDVIPGEAEPQPTVASPEPATARRPAVLGERFSGLLWWPELPTPSGRYETAEAYAERIRRPLVEAMTPQVYQVDADGNPFAVAALVEPTAIAVPEPGMVRRLTTITAFDVTGEQPQPAASVGLLTSGTVEVFATADDLYVIDGHQTGASADSIVPLWRQQLRPVTTVTKVGFGVEQAGGPTVSLGAQGTFGGRVLNQFAADEQDGFLRVVVEMWGEGSGVRVLEQQGDSLVVVGSIAGLAPQEDLYSVRFVGDRAYFVTFRRVDPLFVVDLSTPTAPTLLGELKVSGFSDHIQPLDENHLLTIGRDADDATGFFQGLQVSIFDVTNPASPALLHRHTLAGGRSTSTAITGSRWRRGDGDHLAFGYFPDEGVITIPVTTDGQFDWRSPFDLPILADDGVALPSPAVPQGEISIASLTVAADIWLPPAWTPPTQQLEVLAFDIVGGIDSLGTIDHDTSVDRAVKIAGQLVGVSASEVSVHDFADPATTLGSVRLDEAVAEPMKDLPVAGPQAFPAIETLVEQAVAGLPVHQAWVARAAETIGDETIIVAEHVSGAVHRLTSGGQVADRGWAAFGFDGIGNAESRPLSRQARGEAFAAAVTEVRSLLSDAVLERLAGSFHEKLGHRARLSWGGMPRSQGS